MRRKLAFTGDASRIVIRASQGIHVLHVEGEAEPRCISAPALGDLAIVGNELWTIEASELCEQSILRRFTPAGEPTGEPRTLAGDARRARLVPAASGRCAILTSEPPSLLLGDDQEPVAREIPGGPDFALPISATRWITCSRGQVALCESTMARWRSDAIMGKARQALDGAVLFDATSAALVMASAAGQAHSTGEPVRHIAVFGLREPVVQHRFTLAGADTIRFARGRGYALAVIARRRIVLLDLRFGSLIAEHVMDRDISDVAIDDSGRRVAISNGDSIDDVVLLSVRDLVASASSARRSKGEESAQPEKAEPPTTSRDSTDEASADRPFLRAAPATVALDAPVVVLGSVAALAPRLELPPVSTEQCVALLDVYRELVAALVECAIAVAWDEGRLTPRVADRLPFRAEVRGILGRSTGNARAEREEALRSVTSAAFELSEAEAALAGRVSPLARLVAEFGLSKTAHMILLVIAGPVLWGELARLYAILSNDLARPLCDELLVSTIMGQSVKPHTIARELDPDAPLIRHGIIRVGAGVRPFAALTVEPVVLHILRGVDAPAAFRDVRVVDSTLRFEDLLLPLELKKQIAAAMMVAPVAAPRLVVRGRDGSGRHTLLATLAAASGRRLGVIDASVVVRDLARRADELRQSMLRAHLLGLLPCIDGLEAMPSDDPAARELVSELLRHHPGPLALRLPRDVQPPLDPGYIGIDVPPLTISERLAAWNSALAAHDLVVREPVDLATTYNAGPGEIIRACWAVARAQPRPGDAQATRSDASVEIEAALRQRIQARVGATATRVERLATWSQVILPSDIQDSLTELIARVKHRRIVYDTWNFDRVVTSSRGVVALFAGGPGTGKTMVAGALANDLGMDLYRVDLSRIMSKWIGETEQNLARLFDAAEDAHAIILFDEADSLFAKRTKVQSSVDRYANSEVNYLLQRLDSFEGIAILTTNFGSAIDRAFSRRLTVRITFPFPDEEMREQLWRAHLPTELPTAGKIDIAALARRFRMSGGYIRNAALRAAFLAAEEHSPLTQDHLERAVRAEFREIGQLSDSSLLE